MTMPISIEIGRRGSEIAVARIQSGDELVAELEQGHDAVNVVLHPKSDGSPWTMGCHQLEDLLRQAKLRLVRA